MTHPPISSQITFLPTRNLAKTAQFYEDMNGYLLEIQRFLHPF